MAEQNTQTRRAITILDATTLLPATGLSIAALTVTLERESGDTLAAASETVTLLEVDAGRYWLQFTPENTGVYYLAVSAADATSHYVQPETPFQVDVIAWSSPAGPYLTTRAEFKEAMNLTGSTDDDRIDQLIIAATDYAENYCRRPLTYSASITEQRNGENHSALELHRWPVDSISTVHVSTALPRVYGADELLTAGEDYIVEEESGLLWRQGGDWPAGQKTVQVVYSGGLTPTPADLQRAVEELVWIKLEKGRQKDYHVGDSNVDAGGGSVMIREDDVPPHTREVLDLYRER